MIWPGGLGHAPHEISPQAYDPGLNPACVTPHSRPVSIYVHCPLIKGMKYWKQTLNK